MSPTRDITALLVEARRGEDTANNELIAAVYDELHRLALRHMKRERASHTLQATALVHEAYLRLVPQEKNDWENRAQFYCVAARMMRRVLTDHARKHLAAKRGSHAPRVSLTDVVNLGFEVDLDLLALDDALLELAEFDPDKGRLVELRYFGGFTEEETAEILGVSSRTVRREWRLARAWLFQKLGGGASGGSDPMATH